MSDPSKTYFDKIAGVYDAATAPDGAWTPPSVVANVAAQHTRSDSKVLDIGVGTGQSLVELQKRVPHLTIFGVDPSPAMIAIAKGKFPAAQLEVGDISIVIEKGWGNFDLVLSSGVLEFVKDLSDWFTKAKTLLKHNGIIVFTYEPLIKDHVLQRDPKSLVVPDPNSSLYSGDFYTYRREPEAMEALIRKHGLEMLGKERFVAYQKLNTSVFYEAIASQVSK